MEDAAAAELGPAAAAVLSFGTRVSAGGGQGRAARFPGSAARHVSGHGSELAEQLF